MIDLKVNNGLTQKSFNGILNDFINNSLPRYRDSEWLQPNQIPVNVIEQNNGYELQVIAPGVNKEDIKLAINDNVLSISYDHKIEEGNTDETTGKVLRKEYQLQSFKRSFTLGEQVDVEKISAAFTNGILSLNIPKKEINITKNKVIEIA